MESKHQELLKNIGSAYSKFSKGQKRIADYIVNHYDKAAFMTAAKLGSTAGVSESTVVRFAAELGYEGYPQLRKGLQELIKSKLTSVQRLEVSKSRINEEDVLKSVLQSDIEKIRQTLEEIDKDQFNKIIDVILNAKRIYILGVRSSASLASFLGFYFDLIFDNIRQVNATSTSEVFEQIVRAKKGDVLIGISFPRYSQRTLKAMKYVKSRGAATIAITDSKESPLALAADHSLFAGSGMVSFADSLVAPLSVINALIVAIGVRKKESLYKVFEKLEMIWDEYQVYEKNEY